MEDCACSRVLTRDPSPPENCLLLRAWCLTGRKHKPYPLPRTPDELLLALKINSLLQYRMNVPVRKMPLAIEKWCAVKSGFHYF